MVYLIITIFLKLGNYGLFNNHYLLDNWSLNWHGNRVFILFIHLPSKCISLFIHLPSKCISLFILKSNECIVTSEESNECIVTSEESNQ